VIHIRRFLFQLLHAITVTQRKPPRTKSPHRSASEQFAAPFWTGCSVSCLLVLLRPGELELGADLLGSRSCGPPGQRDAGEPATAVVPSNREVFIERLTRRVSWADAGPSVQGKKS
jgi:hypothetical protein